MWSEAYAVAMAQAGWMSDCFTFAEKTNLDEVILNSSSVRENMPR